MASRRSKDKTPATTGQIVKKESVSPLEIVNRYTHLGTIPRPNYSSVLATPYDPYAMTTVNQPVKTVYPKASNASQYLNNNLFKTCFPLSLIGLPLLIPFHLLLATFPHNFIGSLSMVRKLCNIILISCAMKIQSLLKP